MKTTSLLGILAITPWLAMEVDAQSWLTNGLVAYYPFNGNANDESGHGNNAVVTNAVLIPDRFGMPASAYDFASVDCEMSSPFQGLVESNPRTVSCWVKQKDHLRTNWEDVINWDIGGACAAMFSCGFNAGENFGADRFCFGVSIDVGCGRVVYDAGQWDGRWHQYTWVVPEIPSPRLTDVKMFKDGSLLTTPLWHYVGEAYSSTVLLNSVPQDMTIPRGGAPQGFGAIDDLRIYNRALSDSEIQQLYTYESGAHTNLLSIRVSQVELCWDTLTNSWYQLQYRSTLTTNVWTPLDGMWMAGTGSRYCTNDAVLVGQPQRLYQFVVTNAPPQQ